MHGPLGHVHSMKLFGLVRATDKIGALATMACAAPAMTILQSLRNWARDILRDVMMLWFARRHPDTPFAARALCYVAAAYALSPIDLIPDFIPVLGYLDDALLLPLLVWLAVRLLPAHVVVACRAQANLWMEHRAEKPSSVVGAALIVVVWIALAVLAWRWAASLWQ
jgi:uncharacterized membrane protein YkvA (DUF1232 family)